MTAVKLSTSSSRHTKKIQSNLGGYRSELEAFSAANSSIHHSPTVISERKTSRMVYDRQDNKIRTRGPGRRGRFACSGSSTPKRK